MERIARLSPLVPVTSQMAEAGDQPPGAALQAAAERLGLDYRHIPIVPGSVAAIADLPGPILAFCRSGKRSATLWALAQASHVDPASILAATREAGYPLDGLRPRLESQ